MRRTLFAAVALLAVVAAGTAGAADTRCTSTFGAVTIKGNLRAGAACVLNGTTVTGDVTVDPGGSLSTANATIGGNVRSKNAASVSIAYGSVGGSVLIQGTTTNGGGFSEVAFGTVKGNVEVTKSAAYVLVVGDTVGGSVRLQDNRGTVPTGDQGDVEALQDTIGGNLQVEHNRLTGSDVNRLLVGNDDVAGDVQLRDNSVTGGASVNYTLIDHNVIDGNFEIAGNRNAGPAGSDDELSVTVNTVGKRLDCRKDTPPATGTDNSAAAKTGECAGL